MKDVALSGSLKDVHGPSSKLAPIHWYVLIDGFHTTKGPTHWA